MNVGLNRIVLLLKQFCDRVALVDNSVRILEVKHFRNNVKNDISTIYFALALKVLLIHSHYLEIFFQKNTPFHKKIIWRNCKHLWGHNCTKDVIALSATLNKLNVTKTLLQSYKFSLSSVEQYNKFLSDKKKLAKLHHLVTCRVISERMSEKILRSDWCYQHL